MTKFWHIATKDEIEDNLNTDFERGMTNEFAQSKLKQKDFSYKGKIIKPESFAVCFSTVMAILLVILSVVFMFTGKPAEGTTLVILVLISEFLGYGQDIAALFKERKTEKLLEAKAVVIRAGERKVVAVREVVAGDIVVLKKGDIVPCDGRLVSMTNLEVDEKSVTGNENAVKEVNPELTEETPVQEQTNMLFAGSSIVAGECTMVACRTGKETVASSSDEAEVKADKSFMQDKISEVGKVLGVMAFVLIGIAMLLACLFGEDLWQAGALCLALGAVLVPAKLSSVISYIANRGMLKISEDGTVVKSETVAEKLALCDVVITGKSGILTKEEATVRGVFTYDGQWDLNNLALSAAQKSIQGIMLEFAAICTDSAKGKNISEEFSVDNAILDAAKNMGINAEQIEVAAVYPFDAQRKIMTAVAKTDAEYRIISKGNVKEILDRAKQAVSSTDLYDMTEEIKADLLEKCEGAAQNGFKTIAVAYKDVTEVPEREEAEKDLVFVGALILENEIRAESVEMVKELADAGIKTVIATYDTLSVADYVALQAGIKSEETISLTGEEIRELSDAELDEKIHSVSVFASLKPEDKERIVQSYKRTGKTVCMLADSVGDTKSLELCDISVARKDGSDIATQNANVVTDGSFTGFVNTVKKCQALYLDVRKALRFMISGAISLILFVIFALALTSKLPISGAQVLAIGVLVSGLLPFGLPAGGAWENHKLKNVKTQDSVFAKMWVRILVCGIFSAIIALVLFVNVKFFGGFSTDAASVSAAQTVIFVYFVFGGLFNLLVTRINALKLKEGKGELITLGAILIAVIVLVVLALCVPALKIVFGFGASKVLIAIGAALLPAIFSALLGAFKLIKKSEKAEDTNGTDI